MRITHTTIVCFTLIFGTTAVAQAALLGFDTVSGEAQHALEAEFDSHLDVDDLDSWLRELSREPHHVGSARGHEVVDFIAARFREWGYDTEIVEYEVLFPSPHTRELELVAPTRFRASLTEDALEEDPSTFNVRDLLPPYNAFSVERALTEPDGLPDRPWFSHHISAPGFYTGYGVKTIPGVREAIEERQYDLVATEVDAAAVLNNAAVRIRELAQ